MKITKIEKIDTQDQYDLSTITENFYIVVGSHLLLVHNSPAIVCGKDPSNGKFFIGTKSVFNKGTPKINYSLSDIDKNHEGELANKLKQAFPLLKSLNITDVLQGDFLFSSDDLVNQDIDNELCVTFRPNTITYAIPAYSDLGQTIYKAQLGIVFHTKYTGSSLENASASFDVDVSKLKKNPKVWVTDAYFKDVSGTATFTATETKIVTQKLKQIRNLTTSKIKNLLNKLSSSGLLPFMHIYFNSKVKEGTPLSDVQEHVDGLIQFITLKFRAEIDKLKTDKSKNDRAQKLNDLVNFIELSRVDLYNLYTIQKLLIECKLMVLQKLQKTKTIGTFVKTDNGFRVTTPEGFVAVSNTDKALKLVDRLEFSRLNLTIAKNWGS